MKPILVASCALAAVVSAAPVTAAPSAPRQSPTTVRVWMDQEFRLFYRYLAVVQQAVHDYAYGYQTPALMMPIAMDLFTGYVARIHEMQERFIYPVMRPRMKPEQLRFLALIEHDQQVESDAVKQWQKSLESYEQGGPVSSVVEPLEHLARMLNRHLVLSEEQVFPILEGLAPKEQQAVLAQIAAFERQEFRADGHARYEQLLAYIEGQIQAVAGRIW